jgi:hypothetical protein
MKNNTAVTRFSALRITASLFGVLAGLGGITHGIGEVMQGNTATDGLWIYSWAQGPIATSMGGEPGITIVPNFLITGILCLAVSLAVIIWAMALVQKRMGGIILIGLSIAMLLVGGGVGPPIIGILAGVAGTGINARLTWWRSHLPVNFRQFLAKLWLWVFGFCAVSGVLLVVGSVILVYFFDVNNPDFFTYNFYFTVLALIIAILTGVAHDIQVREEGGTKK